MRGYAEAGRGIVLIFRITGKEALAKPAGFCESLRKSINRLPVGRDSCIKHGKPFGFLLRVTCFILPCGAKGRGQDSFLFCPVRLFLC